LLTLCYCYSVRVARYSKSYRTHYETHWAKLMPNGVCIVAEVRAAVIVVVVVVVKGLLNFEDNDFFRFQQELLNI